MVKRVENHKHTLKYLCNSNRKDTATIIKAGGNDLVDTLCECCLNILNGCVPLTNLQKKRLKKHKNKIRLLSKRSTPRKKRIALLNQKGGFLHFLLPAVLSAITA